MVPRKILSAARTQLALVMYYYLTTEVLKCTYFIFRANFRGVCSPVSSFKLTLCDGWKGKCRVRGYQVPTRCADLCDDLLAVAGGLAVGRGGRVQI